MSRDLFILSLLATHFIGDFVFQSDWMAINKSKNSGVLALHVFVYTCTFAWVPLAFHVAPVWLFLNGLLHFVTDYFTSRATSKLWVSGKRHWFFVMIGFDQLIHFACLILTL